MIMHLHDQSPIIGKFPASFEDLPLRPLKIYLGVFRRSTSASFEDLPLCPSKIYLCVLRRPTSASFKDLPLRPLKIYLCILRRSTSPSFEDLPLRPSKKTLRHQSWEIFNTSRIVLNKNTFFKSHKPTSDGLFPEG